MDATIVTSGIYERMFKKDGRLYHHIIDSDTGYPADTDLEAVTIVAAKGNSGFCRRAVDNMPDDRKGKSS